MTIQERIRLACTQRIKENLSYPAFAIYMGRSTYKKFMEEIEGQKEIDLRSARAKYHGLFIYKVDCDDHLRVF